MRDAGVHVAGGDERARVALTPAEPRPLEDMCTVPENAVSRVLFSRSSVFDNFCIAEAVVPERTRRPRQDAHLSLRRYGRGVDWWMLGTAAARPAA